MNKITFKKNYLSLLIALFLFTINTTSAQGCIVYDDLTFNERQKTGIIEQEFQIQKNLFPQTTLFTPTNYTITPKQFRINFYSELGTSDHDVTVNTNYNLILKYLERLNRLYEPYQICFILNDVKDYYWHHVQPYDTNAINVYIKKNLNGGAHGIANYFSNIIYVKESAMWSEEALLAHEIGHALNLRHTHGNFNRPPTGNCYDTNFLNNCEHITRDANDPNYNATTAGDLVYDTAADPGLFTNNSANYPNCQNVDATGNYIGNQVDCQGTPYALDASVLKNIMAYNEDQHRILLTQGQAERIHYSIDNADPASASIKRALITLPETGAFDLMMRNSPEDYGTEPDTISTTLWDSPDVWIRNNNDNNTTHQNPYNAGVNYVKIRLTNKGCSQFTQDGVTKLKLYWSKAGTNLPKTVWDGGILTPTGFPMGGLIGEVNITNINSYEEMIFTFPWNAPYSGDYTGVDEPWHFCLLAKIESPNDVSSHPQDDGYSYFFRNSNNIVLKNVTLVDNTNNSGKIHIGNFKGNVKNYKIKLTRDKYHYPNTNIFNEAEIKFTFDDKLWKIWQSTGFQGSNFKKFGDKTIIVNENTEILLNNFPAKDFGLLNVKVNFLTNAYTNNDQFGFNVEHWDNNTKELIGGELYLVNKNKRGLFNADAFVTNNTLQAVQINEPAIYNWYDDNGNFLHTGQNYTINNTSGLYLLEVVADYDGYKDMKEVTLTPNNTLLLHNIYPNPATSNVTVQYNQLNCNNAYLMLVNVNSNLSSNYILNLNNTNININTTQFASGLYRLVLVCDNNVTESHNLIIQ